RRQPHLRAVHGREGRRRTDPGATPGPRHRPDAGGGVRAAVPRIPGGGLTIPRGWQGSGRNRGSECLPQYDDGFLTFGESVAGGREETPLDDDPALLEDPQGRPVTGSGGGDERPFGDFLEQQVQRPAGDPHAPIRPVDPVPDMVLAVPREAADVPDQLP